MAAKTTIVEAEELVEPDEIYPEATHTPGIYVNRVVPELTPEDIQSVTEPKLIISPSVKPIEL